MNSFFILMYKFTLQFDNLEIRNIQDIISNGLLLNVVRSTNVCHSFFTLLDKMLSFQFKCLYKECYIDLSFAVQRQIYVKLCIFPRLTSVLLKWSDCLITDFSL